MPDLSFDLGMTAMTTRDADGFYRVQIDGYGDAGGQPMEAYHPCGFFGRPRDPVVDPSALVDVGATVLYAEEGNKAHAIHLNDPRAMSGLPEVKKGGTIAYPHRADSKASFELFDGDNGSFQLYVAYGSTAATIAIDVSTHGAESIQIVHGAGMRIAMTAGGKNSVVIHNRTGDAYVEVNDDGVNINGNSKVVGSVVAGNVAAAQSVVLGDGLLAWIAQVNVALIAAAAASGLSPNPTIVAPTAVPIVSQTLKASPGV